MVENPAGSRLARLLLAALLAPLAAAVAQNAVVTRNVNVRAGPSTATAVRVRLEPEDELWVLSAQKRDGYYQVRTATGASGWAWSRNVRLLVPAESLDTVRAPGPAEEYRGCPLEGNATSQRYRDANRLKNRVAVPQPSDIDAQVTLAALLQTGADEGRWSATRAASVVGFVHDVKPGGEETVNCGEGNVAHRDTHIEIVAGPGATGPAGRVIVEVTPRWRAFMADSNQDWSSAALAQRLEGRWVRFTGWLFWDFPHGDEARNTNPGGAHVWRATAWEIHPVTAIVVCPGNGPQGC
jgi:hypothetical protein